MATNEASSARQLDSILECRSDSNVCPLVINSDEASEQKRSSDTLFESTTSSRAKGNIGRYELIKNEVNRLCVLENALYTILAFIVQLIFGFSWIWPEDVTSCDDTNASEEDVTSCDDTNASEFFVCSMQDAFVGSQSTYEFLVSFVLGGFAISSVNIWRERRAAYTKACGATRNLIINVTSIIPDEVKSARVTMARWAVLGYEICVLKARDIIDTDESREYLTCRALLAETEWESMVKGDRHTTVWWWIQKKAAHLKKQGKISDIEFQILCEAITLIRDRANDLMARIARDQPPPYSLICAILVNTYLFLNAVASGLQWAIWQHEMGVDILKYPRYYESIFIISTKTLIFAGLYDLSTTLYNPFGPRLIDVPHKNISPHISHLAKTLALGKTPASMDKSEIAAKASREFLANEFEKIDDIRESYLSEPKTVLFRQSQNIRVVPPKNSFISRKSKYKRSSSSLNA